MHNAPTQSTEATPSNKIDFNREYYSSISPKSGTLPVIIRTYKSNVTKMCRGNGINNSQWQRNYYEHIIRNNETLNEILKYIISNPQKWDLDNENLLNKN